MIKHCILDSNNVIVFIGYNIKETQENYIADGVEYPKNNYQLSIKDTALDLEVGKYKIENGVISLNENYRKKTYTFNQFADLFEADELKAIYTASKTVVDLEIFLDKVRNANYISIEDEDTINGIGFLYMQGLISEGTYNKIVGV